MELTTKKVTIYRASEFGLGFVKIECRKFGFEHRSYAQFDNAVSVHFVGKGKRNTRGFVETTHPSCVVLEGHGHPDAPSPWTAWKQSDTGCVVREGRHSGFSPEWGNEINALIDTYVAESGAKVLLDTRGNNPYRAETAA